MPQVKTFRSEQVVLQYNKGAISLVKEKRLPDRLGGKEKHELEKKRMEQDKKFKRTAEKKFDSKRNWSTMIAPENNQ